MLKNPGIKYLPFTPINLPDRQWTNNVIRKPPTWVSTDLRDGNQALATPLTVNEKIALFRQLVSCGFKEIEVAFPSASDTEYMFVRKLIESNEIPGDVCIQVMVPAREDLLRRTFDAVRGAKRVSLQLYAATASLYREVIFKCSETDLIGTAVKHTEIARQLANAYRVQYGTSFKLVYGLESFSQSNLDFVIDICTKVQDAWQCGNSPQSPDTEIVFNLAATVECAPANHFADQVEYFRRNMPQDRPFVIGVHTHNDRGTAVASTELALLAGAERVDGCLFGNGERTGNADLVTLALNMYSQGISPGLDFSNLAAIAELFCSYTRIPIHPRHPYVGSLTFTAYSGGHQDGIKKGFEAMALRHHQAEAACQPKFWQMPYLPVDPADFGLVYEVVRINSQSGKAGVAFVTEQLFGLSLPRIIQTEFAAIIQDVCDQRGTPLNNTDISDIFRATFYLYDSQSIRKSAPHISWTSISRTNSPVDPNKVVYQGLITVGEKISPFLADEDIAVTKLLDYLSNEMNCLLGMEEIPNDNINKQCPSTSFIQLSSRYHERTTCWTGIGQGSDPTVAKLQGIISAVNRAFENGL